MGIDWGWLYNQTTTTTHDLYVWVYNYIDVHYMQWLAWLFYPLILSILVPLFIVLSVYISAIFLHLYRLRNYLRTAVQDAVDRGDLWDGAKHLIGGFWDAQGKIWHGYEVIGLEKIPSTGPALLIYYHGAIPIDMYYLMAKIMFVKKRQIMAVGDKFLFRLPGFRLLMEVFNVLPGTVSRGVELMKEGHLLSIAPGGVREAYFSDEYYKTVWGNRVGFAKVALQAGVPVIPLFTQNCREAFRSLSLGQHSWLRWLYEKTRLPIIPIYGGLPVKLRTFIGEPIPHDPSLTPEELAKKVEDSLAALISRHQRIPGNILQALLERFYTPEHVKQS